MSGYERAVEDAVGDAIEAAHQQGIEDGGRFLLDGLGVLTIAELNDLIEPYVGEGRPGGEWIEVFPSEGGSWRWHKLDGDLTLLSHSPPLPSREEAERRAHREAATAGGIPIFIRGGDEIEPFTADELADIQEQQSNKALGRGDDTDA